MLKLICSFLLIVFASLTFHRIFIVAHPSYEILYDACSLNPTLYLPFSTRFDSFLCFIIPFYKGSAASSLGKFITSQLLSLLTVLVFTMSVEGSRKWSLIFVAFVPFYVFFMQFFTIAVTWSLFVVGLFYCGSSDHVPVSRSIASLVCLMSLSVVGLIMINGDGVLLEQAIALFQILPLLLTGFVFVLTPTGRTHLPIVAKQKRNGHYILFSCFVFLGGAATLAWLLALTHYYDGLNLESLLVLFDAPDFDTFSQFVLLMDFTVSFIAVLLFVLVTDGIGVLFVVLLSAILIGPAASAAIYFAFREMKLVTLMYDQKKIKNQ